MKSPFRWYKERKKKKRLEEVRKDPYKRVDSDKMTDVEKMDKGYLFHRGTLLSSRRYVHLHYSLQNHLELICSLLLPHPQR